MIDERPPSSPGNTPGATAGPAGGHHAARIPAGAGLNNPNASANLHIYDRLGVIVKYWKAAAVVFVIAASVVLYKAYSAVPVYRATAQLYIDDEVAAETNVNNPLFAYADPEVYIKTQVKILTSRDLARRAVKRLNLEAVPEFNGQGPKPTKVAELIAAVKHAVIAPFGGPTAAPAPAPRPSNDPEQFIDAFKGHIVPEIVSGTKLLNVHYTGSDPLFAAKAANTLADEYVAMNLETKTKKIKDDLGFIDTQVQEAQQKVLDINKELTLYRENQEAYSLDDKQNIVESTLSKANDDFNSARSARISQQTAYEAITKGGAKPEEVPQIVNTAAVASALARRNAAQEKVTQMQRRYGANYPALIEAQQQLAQAEKTFKDEVDRTVIGLKTELDGAKAKEAELKQALDSAQVAAQGLSVKAVNYDEIKRQLDAAQEAYKTLLQHKSDLEVAANSKQNNVRISDRARPPAGPTNNDTSRAWIIALLIGTAAGVASAFALDYLDDTVKTPDDIRWRLKVHFLGLVPKVRGNNRPLLSDSVPPAFGEAFRALRTALVIRSGSSDTRIVAMTSAQPLEGKTTTAVNTALALAIGGARVLLIDADMRRPSIHKALRMANQKGLSELLQAQAKMREVVRTTVHPNLLAVSAGSPPTNPSELLASDRMRALLEQLEQGPFDWVIIDTPPVLAVTDAVILAPLVSAVTFVVGAEMTRWRLAERAIETLQSGNPRSISAVLNRVDFDRNRYYYTRYYGQHYYSYYAEDVAAAS
jgi:capsular exopolysaccharide synthesis family protein